MTNPHLSTHLIHHPYAAPTEFSAPQQPVHKASTVFFPDVATMRSRRWLDKSGYTYGLHGTPTSFTLEERLCALEGGQQCLLVPSGLAAISTVSLALLSQGDEVLIPDNAYGPNKDFAQHELARYGIRYAFFNPMDVEDLRSKLSPATKLVWLEAPGSVTMEFPDLLAQVQLVRQHGALSALDNTWGAGLAFLPFDLLRDGGSVQVDISAHALTKYPSGGGDVLMGSIITRDNALHMRLKLAHMRLGLGVGMNDVELVLRSLPSTALRYHAQDKTARQLAAALQRQNAVKQLLHPAFASSPGHAHWQQLCATPENPAGAAAGIFSVVFDAPQSQVDDFCNRLQLFKLGYSWGGHISLVMPYALDEMRDLGRGAVLPGCLVRLCIGLEEAADLSWMWPKPTARPLGTRGAGKACTDSLRPAQRLQQKSPSVMQMGFCRWAFLPGAQVIYAVCNCCAMLAFCHTWPSRSASKRATSGCRWLQAGAAAGPCTISAVPQPLTAATSRATRATPCTWVVGQPVRGLSTWW